MCRHGEDVLLNPAPSMHAKGVGNVQDLQEPIASVLQRNTKFDDVRLPLEACATSKCIVDTSG